ncbi:hypothetical protein A0H81_12034 [Grifola frondosa]|uniref:Uncharacterized protein n=1 Tax=Grifola frondosa TaxID=5627 RepID=A0A1C7LV30_GRIFR|nr:hypothetical protein A0H81_12034 [Grifola frondosa]
MYYSPSGLRFHCGKLIVAVGPNICLTCTLEMRMPLALLDFGQLTQPPIVNIGWKKLCIIVVIPLEACHFNSHTLCAAGLHAFLR